MKWGQAGAAAWPVELCIAAHHRAGLMHDIGQLFQAEKVTLLKLLTHGDGDGDGDNTVIRARLEITGLRQLGRLTRRLQALPGVRRVSRQGAAG